LERRNVGVTKQSSITQTLYLGQPQNYLSAFLTVVVVLNIEKSLQWKIGATKELLLPPPLILQIPSIMTIR